MLTPSLVLLKQIERELREMSRATDISGDPAAHWLAQAALCVKGAEFRIHSGKVGKPLPTYDGSNFKVKTLFSDDSDFGPTPGEDGGCD